MFRLNTDFGYSIFLLLQILCALAVLRLWKVTTYIIFLLTYDFGICNFMPWVEIVLNLYNASFRDLS